MLELGRFLTKKFPMERESDALQILAAEFYPDEPKDEVIDRYRKLIEKFVHTKTGAKLEITRDTSSKVTGFLLTKFYPWEAIKNQLFIGVEIVDTKPHLFLAPFSHLVKEQIGKKTKIELAAELAFYWIDEINRGKGLGSVFFNNFLNQAAQLSQGSNCLVFTTARAKQERAKQGSEIFEYLLKQEKARNGFSAETNKTIVTGVLISLQQIVRDLSLGVPDINLLTETHEEARVTDHLAEKNMMKLVGYSRKMGKIFVKIVPRSL